MDTAKNSYQVMPPLSEEEYQALKADIAEHGVWVPIVKDAAGNTIDGHHRERAWRELTEEGHNVPDCPVEVRGDLATDAEKRELAWRLNMQRRHLNQAQKRDAIAAKLRETPEWADNRIAQLLGVDHKTVRSVRLILEIRKEIPTVDMVEGKDGNYYPRSRTGDLEYELAEAKTDAVRQELYNRVVPLNHLGEEAQEAAVQEIASKWGVSVEHVEDQRKDMEESGLRLKDLGEEKKAEVLSAAQEYAYGNYDQRRARYIRETMTKLADMVVGYSRRRKEIVAEEATPDSVAESVAADILHSALHRGDRERFREKSLSIERERLARYKLLCEWILRFVPLLEEKFEKRLAIEREVSDLRHELQEEEDINPPPV